MIADFKKLPETQGLEIHPDKTQILTYEKTNRTDEVEIDAVHVEILLPEGKEKYLGQTITFVDQETTEVLYRIRCAWSTFPRHRLEVTFQSYLLRHRLHLFDAAVSLTVTYGVRTWTTTKEPRRMNPTVHSVGEKIADTRANKD